MFPKLLSVIWILPKLFIMIFDVYKLQKNINVRAECFYPQHKISYCIMDAHYDY